jgi:hypothetical protein
VHHPCCASTNLEVRLEYPIPTCFHVKKGAKSRRVFYAVFIIPSVLWRNRKTITRLVLRLKPRNRRGDFDPQIIKP